MSTNRKIAAALILAMLCTALCASLLIACGVFHVCAGEDCTVCSCLNFAEKICEMLVAALVTTAVFASLVALGSICFLNTGAGVARLTPTRLKVRLLN